MRNRLRIENSKVFLEWSQLADVGKNFGLLASTDIRGPVLSSFET